MAESEKSITWVVTAAMILIALFGWCFLAGSYNGAYNGELRNLEEITEDMSDEELSEFVNSLSEEKLKEYRDVTIVTTDRPSPRSGIMMFVVTAAVQLPNFLTVIGWHFTNRIWLPIVIIGLELLIFLVGLKMKSIENEMAQPYRRKFR